MAPWLGPAVATKSRTGEILVGNIVPQVFATVFVIARIISKACIRRKWSSDDTMLCIAWATSLALTALSCTLTKYGAGIHADELPDWTLRVNRKLQYASLIIYCITLSLTKMTVCLFYLDIFADPLNRRLAKAALSFVVAYTIPLVTLSVLQCIPIAANWDPALREGARCVPMQPHFWVSAICNMVADAWLAVQVVPNILPLQIPRRQKTVLLIVVSLGWLVIVASTIRLVRIRAIPDGSDFTWASYDVTIWSAVEVDTGLVCVAAPSTKPLFKKIAPGFLKTLVSESGDSAQSPVPSLRLGNLADEETGRRGRSGRRGSDGLEDLDEEDEEREEEEARLAAKAAENGVGGGWDLVGGLVRSLSTRSARSDRKRGSLASVSSGGTFAMGEIVKEVDFRVETTERAVGPGSSLKRFSFAAGFRNSVAGGWRGSWKPSLTTKI